MATRTGAKTAISLLLVAKLGNAPRPSDAEEISAIVDLWESLFADTTDDELCNAVRAFLAEDTRGWWPVPALIRQRIPRIEAARLLATQDDSDEAWGRIRRYAEAGTLHAEYGGPTVTLTPAEEAGVQAAGGRRQISFAPYEQHAAMRAAFRGAYRSAKERSQVTGGHHAQLTSEQATRLLVELARRNGAGEAK